MRAAKKAFQKKDSFSRLFQFCPGKTFTLREIICGETNQQSTPRNNMKETIDGIEVTEASEQQPGKADNKQMLRDIAGGCIFMVVVMALIVCWFHFFVKPHDKALADNPANQVHHDRVVIVQPQ